MFQLLWPLSKQAVEELKAQARRGAKEHLERVEEAYRDNLEVEEKGRRRRLWVEMEDR